MTLAGSSTIHATGEGVRLLSHRPSVLFKLEHLGDQGQDVDVSVEGVLLSGPGWGDRLRELMSDLGSAERALLFAVRLDDPSGLPLAAKTLLARARTDWFPKFLSQGSLTPVFQPLVDLADGTVYGREALIRGRMGKVEVRGQELIEAAEVHDAIFSFDARARAAVLDAGLPILPEDEILLVKLDPRAVLDVAGSLRAVWDQVERAGGSADRVGLELMNAERYGDPELLVELVEAHRERGAVISLDDMSIGTDALTCWKRSSPTSRSCRCTSARASRPRRPGAIWSARSSKWPTSSASVSSPSASSGTPSSSTSRSSASTSARASTSGSRTRRCCLSTAASSPSARRSNLRAVSDRDLFANFERMRREMDELFGDVFGGGMRTLRRAGFSPSVDVFYVPDPPRAIVRAELAGVDANDLALEIRGRELILAGVRNTERSTGRAYQQLEIERGEFRRVVALGVEVDAGRAHADYTDGMLTVELPVVARDLPRPLASRRPHVPASDRDRVSIDVESGAGDGREIAVGGAGVVPDQLPVLPLRDSVTYPDTLTPLAVGQERSIQLVNDVLAGNRMLAMVASKDPDLESPGPKDLHEVGVSGTIARMLKVPDGSLRILVQGAQRIRVAEWIEGHPYPVARAEEIPDVIEEGPELTALMRNVQQTFSTIIEEVPYLPEELQMAVANVDDPSALSHLIAGALRIPTEEKQALLEETHVARRLRRLSEILARELEVVAIGSRIQSQVQSEIDRSQREFVLRQQLKAIQEELGERDPGEAEVEDLHEQLEARELPADVRTQAERELGRLEKLPQAAAEHGVIRTYLEWILSLPWDKTTVDNLDLKHARAVLDADHYDIARVKDRILEFLAVRRLKPDAKGSILCLVGPPGVGKTSLGRSIANALERKFERISVGGMRDESEIRGHRRTYIGAMPGVILRALRDAESSNPLFMIDEIDKMGSDFRGDPASAMLEVLDPEQNESFRDHYLDLPFDLSKVMFVTTANTLDTIPGPLRDRMEVIQLAGYTEEEKLQIAKRYLVPRQIERSGVRNAQIAFTDKGLKTIISEYTREAGVRQLEREIGGVCRKVAMQVAEGTLKRKVSVTEPRVRELLGRQKFFVEARRRTREPGVATGLAWTPVGGDVLFVEATWMPGTGKLTLTGQLGDVMRESAMAALSYVRGHARGYAPELPDAWFAEHDLHLHVPSGAIPKDGPSAGVTMATALVSLLTGRAVRSDVAMTGELTLTGQVLPIGGLKEKALAAQRSGLKHVIAPARNEADLEDIPEHLRTGMTFTWVSEIDQVLDAALGSRVRNGSPG